MPKNQDIILSIILKLKADVLLARSNEQFKRRVLNFYNFFSQSNCFSRKKLIDTQQGRLVKLVLIRQKIRENLD